MFGQRNEKRIEPIWLNPLSLLITEDLPRSFRAELPEARDA